MTRRPYAPHAQRVARAGHNLTAPGKKWSESPAARPGVVRPPRQAASVTEPIVLPPLDWFYKTTYGSYSSSGRFAASFDVNEYLGDLATPGCPISVVIMSEASVTAPAGWETLWSYTFDDFNVLVAGIGGYNSESTVFLQNWAGVTGLGEWSYCVNIFYPNDEIDEPWGWTWDIKIQNNGATTTGTWAAPTDPDWSYSLPLMVTEDCELVNNYLYNSYGGYYTRYGQADTHGWVWFARPGDNSEQYYARAYKPLGLSYGLVWRPDQYYELYTNSEFYGPGPEYNATMCLGLKVDPTYTPPAVIEIALDVSEMRDYWGDPLPTVVGGSTGAEVLSDPSTNTYIQMSATQEAYLQYEAHTLEAGATVSSAWLSFKVRQAGTGDNELGTWAEFDVYDEGSGNVTPDSNNITGISGSWDTYTTPITNPGMLTASRLAEGLFQCDIWNYSAGSSIQIAYAQLHFQYTEPA